MLIVFEGIDNSGKSTLSKEFLGYLNTPEVLDKLSQLDYLKPSFRDRFTWTKEPQFTTEEADMLNSPEFKDEYRREAFFFVDRSRHVPQLKSSNHVCDRYIWTGLAYAKKFSPNCYDFVKHLYSEEALFPRPDLHIFVDTPVEICDQRDPSVGLDRLNSLRESYMSVSPLVARIDELIIISAEEGVEKSLETLIAKFEEWLEAKLGTN